VKVYYIEVIILLLHTCGYLCILDEKTVSEIRDGNLGIYSHLFRTQKITNSATNFFIQKRCESTHSELALKVPSIYHTIARSKVKLTIYKREHKCNLEMARAMNTGAVRLFFLAVTAAVGANPDASVGDKVGERVGNSVG